MTAPRIVVPGATTALTRRTTLRKAFLADWDPRVEQCFLYSLADAQRHTGVAVHHAVRVVTHHHTSATPSRDNFPEFARRFHRDLSCSLNALLCEQRYDAPRELFDDRAAHMMRLVDEAAQASHLVYEYLNPVAAGLVQRPEHVPGRTLDFGLWKVGYIEVERPAVYFDSSRPERLRLELTPPPLLYRAFGGDLDALVYHMQQLAEDGMRAIRGARSGPVLGARRLSPFGRFLPGFPGCRAYIGRFLPIGPFLRCVSQRHMGLETHVDEAPATHSVAPANTAIRKDAVGALARPGAVRRGRFRWAVSSNGVSVRWSFRGSLR